MKKILVFGLIAFMLGSCGNTESTPGHSTEQLMNKQQTVSKEDFKAFMEANENIQLVDVRTPEEYGAGSIEGAKNIDFYGSNFQAELSKLNKEEPVLIYCKSGGRSGQTLALLKEMGFKTVLDLDGGFSNW